jgi:hypothetical protein
MEIAVFYFASNRDGNSIQKKEPRKHIVLRGSFFGGLTGIEPMTCE